MMLTFQQKVQPQIEQEFAASGRTMSAQKGRTVADSLTSMSTDAQAQLAQAQMSNQQLAAQMAQNAVSNQINGIQLAGQQTQAPIANAMAIQQAMQPYMNNQQAGLTADYNTWSMQQPYNNPWLQTALGYINSSQTAMYQPQGTNWGGIGAIAGMAAGAIAAPFTAGLSLLPAMAAGSALGGGIGGIASGGSGGSLSSGLSYLNQNYNRYAPTQQMGSAPSRSAF
jgi:hypothetical protein